MLLFCYFFIYFFLHYSYICIKIVNFHKSIKYFNVRNKMLISIKHIKKRRLNYNHAIYLPIGIHLNVCITIPEALNSDETGDICRLRCT